MSAHTPTPWLVPNDAKYVVTAHEGATDVAECWLRGGTVGQDNAAHIVLCVNAHEPLLALLRCAKREIHNPGANQHAGFDILEAIDAALAKAEDAS